MPPYFTPSLTSVCLLNLIIILKLTGSEKSRALMPLAITTLWWHCSWIFLFHTKDYLWAQKIATFGHVGILYLPVGVCWFLGSYYGEKRKILLILAHTVYLFLLTLLFFSNLIISDVLTLSFGFYPKAGLLHPVFIVFISLVVSHGIFITIKHYKDSEADQKKHLLITIISILIFTCSSVDFLINYGLATFYPFGYVFSLIFVSIVTFSLFKYSFLISELRIQNLERMVFQEEKMASLGRLTAGFSHEINTPIGICLSDASFNIDEVKKLEKLDSLSDDDRYLIADLGKSNERIVRNLRKASGLINKMKLISVDQSINQLRLFDISELIEHTVDSYRHKLLNQNIDLVIDLDKSLRYYGDPGALTQVFMILFENAFAHAFDQRSKGKIEITLNADESSITIFFRDDGKGMDSKTVQMVFEPFFTTKLGSGGTGLGMYIAFNIVIQGMQGTISVDSKIDQGTSFKIVIPHRSAKVGKVENSNS